MPDTITFTRDQLIAYNKSVYSEGWNDGISTQDDSYNGLCSDWEGSIARRNADFMTISGQIFLTT